MKRMFPPIKSIGGSIRIFCGFRRINGVLLSGWESLLDLIYPSACGACGVAISGQGDAVSRVFCFECREALEPIGPGACSLCSAPRIEFREDMDLADACPDCSRLNPSFEKVLVPWLYGGPLLEAIHALKYEKKSYLAKPLAGMLMPALSVRDAFDLVVPVPTHRERIRQRGFDHASCLADEVGGLLGLPVSVGVLERSRSAPPQASLKLGDRLNNLKGSVHVSKRGASRLNGRKVLLIDDVMTTGATADACAKALLGAGARSVVVAVLARAA